MCKRKKKKGQIYQKFKTLNKNNFIVKSVMYLNALSTLFIELASFIYLFIFFILQRLCNFIVNYFSFLGFYDPSPPLKKTAKNLKCLII